MNRLFLLNLQIGRGQNMQMPPHRAGAFVAVYVAAADHEAALIQAVAQIQSRDYEFIDLAEGKVHQPDPLQWDRYVTGVWPEFACISPARPRSWPAWPRPIGSASGRSPPTSRRCRTEAARERRRSMGGDGRGAAVGR